MSSFTNEICGDVQNWDNSVERWADAIDYFNTSCATLREGNTGEHCCVNAVIDVSGSMDGSKLIAVKLGICSLVANLSDEDEMNIMSFSGKVKHLTDGFVPVRDLRRSVPSLLHGLHTDGCTAFYDAVIKGITTFRSHCREVEPVKDRKKKNIMIALTDGADNESCHKARHVLQHICNPGISQFMFLLVAADMQRREERSFQEWMDLVHCKQVSVSVKTGTRLVGVFKEMLLSRILQTEADNARFLQLPGEGIDIDLSKHARMSELDATFETLRQQMTRKVAVGGASMAAGCCNEDDMDDNSRCDSCGISRVSSCSDHGDMNDMWSSDSDTDYDDEDLDEADDDKIEIGVPLRRFSLDSADSVHEGMVVSPLLGQMDEAEATA
jgi:uncharacterized protein YegL